MTHELRHSLAVATLLALIMSAGTALPCLAKDQNQFRQQVEDCATLRQQNTARFRALCGSTGADRGYSHESLATPGTGSSAGGDMIMLYPGWQATTRQGSGTR